MSRLDVRKCCVASMVAIALQVSPGSVGAVEFADVTTTLGIPSGQYFSIALPDVDRDGDLDLWLGNHLQGHSALYVQAQPGIFIDRSSFVDIDPSQTDPHGASWGDFDNDLQEEAFIAVGADRGAGSRPNHLLKASGGFFNDISEELGLAYAYARGRAGIWLDWDHNGELDLLFLAKPRPDNLAGTELFIQSAGKFVAAGRELGLDYEHELMFGAVADLGGDSSSDVLLQSSWRTPRAVLTLGDSTFTDISQSLGLDRLQNVYDLAISDFDGDLVSDVFYAIDNHRRNQSDMFRSDARHVTLHFGATNREHAVDLSTGNGITLVWPLSGVAPPEVTVGSQGLKSSAFPLHLSNDDPMNQGIQAHQAGADKGLYIGYSKNLGVWQVVASNELVDFLFVEGDEDINNVGYVGFNPSDTQAADALYTYNSQRRMYEDRSDLSGLMHPSACASVTAGDFDNDMDVDIVMSCSHPLTDLPDLLLENDGGGTFSGSPLAVIGGQTDGGWSSIGEWWRGSGVVSGDLNGDGCLDLLFSGTAGLSHWLSGEPLRVLENTCGSGRHWLKLDLVGVESAGDAIGAKVIVSAGGHSQLREIGTETHAFAQDARQLHFGLAGNEWVDRIDIFWPSGNHQVLGRQWSDQRIEVFEHVADSAAAVPGFKPSADADAVRIWKEYFDGPYHLRVSAASGWRTIGAQLISDGELVAKPYGLESSDTLRTSPHWVALDSEVRAGGFDGIDFWASPNAKVLISTSLERESNLRLCRLGGGGRSATPSGWILTRDELLQDQAVSESYSDIRLFEAADVGEIALTARQESTANSVSLDFISSSPASGFTTQGLDPDDVVTPHQWGWQALLNLTQSNKEIRFAPVPEVAGFVAYHDGVVRRDRVLLSAVPQLVPNAALLPLADPYGAPDAEVGSRGKLYVWKDVDTGRWHLRAAGGGSDQWSTYRFGIRTTKPMSDLRLSSIEPNDRVEQVSSQSWELQLSVVRDGLDELSFYTPADSDLEISSSTAASLIADMRIGAQRWPVRQLPLRLAGW